MTEFRYLEVLRGNFSKSFKSVEKMTSLIATVSSRFTGIIGYKLTSAVKGELFCPNLLRKSTAHTLVFDKSHVECAYL